MIALCHTHADLADGDRWTTDQIRAFKSNPFVTSGQLSADFGYLRRRVVCRIGNLAWDVHDVLTINGERVIGFERDPEGYDRLNVRICGLNGGVILEMVDNDWTVLTDDLHDLNCGAQGKELRFELEDGLTDFRMRFDDLAPEAFVRELCPTFEEDEVRQVVSTLGTPASVPLWTINATLQWGVSRIEINDSEIRFGRGSSLAVSFFHNCGSALALNVLT